MREYLRLGFQDPKNLNKAKKMSRKHVFFYFLILALIVTFSMTSIILGVMSGMREDAEEITENIPTFEIAQNQLMVEDEQESFIHQTDSFLFFFDPNDAIQREEVDTNLERLNVPIGIALLEDGLYVNVVGQSLPMSYEQLDGFNDENMIGLLNQLGTLSPVVFIIVFIITYIASSFSLLYDWLIIALFANIVSMFLKIRSKFTKNARVALLSLSIPTIIISAIEAFGIFLPFSFEIKLGFTLYFIYKSLKKVAPKKTDSD